MDLPKVNRLFRQMKLPHNISLRHDLRAGDVASIVSLHKTLYSAEYGWDETFESHVEGPLAAFAGAKRDRQRIWILEKNGALVGSIAIVRASKREAQLRWLLLHPDIRGQGIGKQLVGEAIDFCRKCGYQSVFLWTEASLTVAGKLYTAAGFKLIEEKRHRLWGTEVREQKYDLNLGWPTNRKPQIQIVNRKF